jgi:hypothetical protein
MTFPSHPLPGGPVSGGFTPASITGLSLWYDFSDVGNTVVSGTFSAVLDKAGGYGLSQSTAAQRPTVVTQNGRNAARFTATASQYMALASAFTPATNSAAFAVWRHGGPSGTLRTETLGSVGSGRAYLEWYTDNKIWLYGTSKASYSPAISDTNYHAVIVNNLNGDTGSIVYYDGGVQSMTTVSNPNTLSYAAFGYSDGLYCNGEIAEFGVYSGVSLAPANIASLQAYLKTKWGTP